MRKRARICFWWGVGFLLALLGCAPRAMEEAPPFPGHAAEDSEAGMKGPEADCDAICFADPVMESLIRHALGGPEGEVTVAEALSLKALGESLPEWEDPVRIATLSDLQHVPNVEVFRLYGDEWGGGSTGLFRLGLSDQAQRTGLDAQRHL